MSESNDEIPQEDEILATAEELLAKGKEANDLLSKLNSKPEFAEGFRGNMVKVFHEVYVVGKVDPYCPKDRGRRHMGWAIYPVNPTIAQGESGGKFKQVEAVSFDDINNEVPEIGDLVHVRREGEWAGVRMSIRIIKDASKELKNKYSNGHT